MTAGFPNILADSRFMADGLLPGISEESGIGGRAGVPSEAKSRFRNWADGRFNGSSSKSSRSSKSIEERKALPDMLWFCLVRLFEFDPNLPVSPLLFFKYRKVMGMKMIDIAVNLTDGMFRGVYRGKRVHPDDFDLVLDRAKEAGVDKIIATGTDLQESKACIQLAKLHPGFVFATVGCHPTNSGALLEDADEYINALKQEIELNQQFVYAVGEIGLDYGISLSHSKNLQIG